MYFGTEFKKGSNQWKKFENDTADVFEKFDYTVDRDIRFKTYRWFQIDFIAQDKSRRFFVDCKNHSYIPPEKEKEFVKSQLIRANNFIEKEGEKKKKNIILLVTRNKTNSLLMHKEGGENVLAVDFYSLPTLLKDIDLYEDELYVF
ncbi:hypothetical protein M1384_00180 [Candidatus Parvarchaeota archaeon]|jgi:hypothetical protein|nr:hypothetical protein [Candidatus Parvarchaeota archaeon]